MLYNRINQFLDRFNVTLNADTGTHNWTDFDAFNEFNENITLSHLINFFTQNIAYDSDNINQNTFHNLSDVIAIADSSNNNDMLNMTEKLRQLDESIGTSLRFGLNSTADLIAFSRNMSEHLNGVGAATINDSDAEPLFVLIFVTICYLFIFVAGVLGNVITCTVIYRNKSMHTATNYYLFNLAISDLILLLSGMPQDTYNIWSPFNYPFTQKICILQGLLSETSTNATVLTITSFTIERYIAICHPFRQHTMSKLSRAVKFIMGIWLVAFCLAIPQAIQFGVVKVEGRGQSCTVKNILLEHAFEVSSFLFFVGPMTLICVLYVLIGVKLRKSKLLQGVKRRGCEFGRGISGQTRVIRMLVAVAVAFFLCWAPFHAQRLMAVYGKTSSTPMSCIFRRTYTVLTYVSGVLYFMSTCINPLLYSIMSHKFRDAFKLTIAKHCGIGNEYLKRNHTYSALSRCNGMGSFKLTAANNPRTSPYNNEQQKHMNIGNLRNGIIDSAFVEMVDCARAPSILATGDGDAKCLSNKEMDNMYRQRFVSVSSQSTLLTTISRADGNGVITTKTDDCGMNNNIDGNDNTTKSPANVREKRHKFTVGPPEASEKRERIVKQPIAVPPTSTLGTIAEKFKRKVFLFKSTSSTANSSSHGNAENSSGADGGCDGVDGGSDIVGGNSTSGRNRQGRKLEKVSSVDSAHTNTISNSSLQEVDDDEFDSTELAKYMGQINNEIR